MGAGGKGEAGVPGGQGEVEYAEARDPDGGVALVGAGPVGINQVSSAVVLREQVREQEGVKLNATEGAGFWEPGTQEWEPTRGGELAVDKMVLDPEGVLSGREEAMGAEGRGPEGAIRNVGLERVLGSGR